MKTPFIVGLSFFLLLQCSLVFAQNPNIGPWHPGDDITVEIAPYRAYTLQTAVNRTAIRGNGFYFRTANPPLSNPNYWLHPLTFWGLGGRYEIQPRDVNWTDNLVQVRCEPVEYTNQYGSPLNNHFIFCGAQCQPNHTMRTYGGLQEENSNGRTYTWNTNVFHLSTQEHEVYKTEFYPPGSTVPTGYQKLSMRIAYYNNNGVPNLQIKREYQSAPGFGPHTPFWECSLDIVK